jgi:transposase
MQCIAGIDVSKDHLDLAIHPAGWRGRFSSDRSGRRALIRRLRSTHVDRVVLEATGGYERPVMLDTREAGFEVIRVNPRQMRRFAQATGRLAKTDRIDADVIAEYGQVIRVPVRPLPSAREVALQEQLARREQLVAMISGERARFKQALQAETRASVQRVLDLLGEELKQVESRLDRAIQQDEELHAQSRVLTAVPGVGPAVSRTLLIALPELGRASRREIAALVGVAPLNRDSGKHQGRRVIAGGRAPVRRVLYMAALVATRVNPEIRAYYEHLQQRGKVKMVALVACMRKLLLLLNARMRDHFRASLSPAGAAATPAS